MTDVGVYLAEWDVDRASFIYKVFLSNEKIRAARVEILERTFMPNSEAIVITTNTESHKFMIINDSASQALMILESRIGIRK